MSTLPKDFFAQLRQVYLESPHAKDYWLREEPILRELLPLVAKKLDFNYKIQTPFAIGGSGIVAFVKDKNLKAKRVLKVSRPSPGKERYLARVLFKETEALMRLSHQNLARVFAQGAVTLTFQHAIITAPQHSPEGDIRATEEKAAAEDFPFYVMDYVEDAKDSDKFLRGPNRTGADVLNLIGGILAAVQYLHSQNEIHMDIKPGNVLATPRAVAVLSDLGFAKQLKSDDNYTLIGGTEGYIHPDALAFVKSAISDPNRLQGETPHSTLKLAWDLYSLGKTLLVLLAEVAKHNPTALTPYQHRYLRLLACRLLDGHNAPDELPAGLSRSAMADIRYRHIDEAVIDFNKLLGLYNVSQVIPELNAYNQDAVQVSTLALTPFTHRVKQLVEHPVVMRLGVFTQLGLLNLVYPTALHTRLEHSLGTFSICCQYVLALYNDAYNPLFRQLMSEADIKAVLLAALLHDVGQCPIAHDIEEAVPTFYSHSEAGLSLLQGTVELRQIVEDEAGWNIKADHVIGILTANPYPTDKPLKGTLRERILHSLIDGCLDADKLDYIVRDSERLGLSYGSGIDLRRLLRCLTIVYREIDDHTYASLGIHEKGKVPAESVAFARYAMFGQVYWHHAYRSVKAMLHRMLLDMLAKASSDDAVARVSEKFRAFVLPKEVSESGQQTLFDMTAQIASAAISPSTAIQQADLAVLQWIADAGGDVAKELLGLLMSRTLYKRLLVLSRDRAGDGTVLSAMYAFHKDNREKWWRRYNLQARLQKAVAKVVALSEAKHPELSVAIHQFLDHTKTSRAYSDRCAT